MGVFVFSQSIFFFNFFLMFYVLEKNFLQPRLNLQHRNCIQLSTFEDTVHKYSVPKADNSQALDKDSTERWGLCEL